MTIEELIEENLTGKKTDIKLRQAVRDAMDILQDGMSMGAIGENGPTLAELDELVEKSGQVWEDNADYHTAQSAWRLLEAGLKGGGDGT